MNLEQEPADLRKRLDELERSRARGGSEWLNETESSRHIGKHDEFLRKLRLQGKGPPWTQIGRQFMRKRADLDQFMADPDSFA
jgi:hypothetical protein